MCTLHFVMVYVLWCSTLLVTFMVWKLYVLELLLCAATCCNITSCGVYLMLFLLYVVTSQYQVKYNPSYSSIRWNILLHSPISGEISFFIHQYQVKYPPTYSSIRCNILLRTPVSDEISSFILQYQVKYPHSYSSIRYPPSYSSIRWNILLHTPVSGILLHTPVSGEYILLHTSVSGEYILLHSPISGKISSFIVQYQGKYPP